MTKNIVFHEAARPPRVFGCPKCGQNIIVYRAVDSKEKREQGGYWYDVRCKTDGCGFAWKCD